MFSSRKYLKSNCVTCTFQLLSSAVFLMQLTSPRWYKQTYWTQVCWSGGHTVCLSLSVLLCCLLLLYLLVCLFDSLTFAFPCQSLPIFYPSFFLNYSTYSLICTSLPLLPVPLTVVHLYIVFPLTCFLFCSMSLWRSAVNFPFFPIPLILSSSPSLLPLSS